MPEIVDLQATSGDFGVFPAIRGYPGAKILRPRLRAQ